ncbi:MAG: outer membrane beta-barrel protein, partial [Sphingobacteriaceae bacterium]|nr:outer membrane beta-barrel protein [Sphingobacteriaceae bacterium]
MKKTSKSIFIAILVLLSYGANAQNNGKVSGKVIGSKDNKPLDYASIAVKSLKDSSVVGSTITNATGNFEIKNLAVGNYKLYVAFLGYRSITKTFSVTANASNVQLGNIVLDDAGIDLNTINIVAEIPPVNVKKDTLEFNAKAFKVKENAVVEDVLKKLPGVEVAKDGTITAQGETIKKVRVDGKDFMGSDPLMATKNLPADMIDKIQVIDEQSEQSKFSGVDDGNREKIINITTLKNKKKGYFGNNTVGYGNDNLYDVNINVNKFNNDQQTSIVGQFNNVNKQTFTQNFGGGGGRGQFFGGTPQGITTTNSLAANFADVYKNQTTVNGSYSYNKTSLFNTSNSLTQNLLADRITTVKNDAISTTDRLNHRFNFMIDTKLDSTTTIRIEPNIRYTTTDANSVNVYSRNLISSLTNGSQTFLTKSTAPVISNNLLLRKKFKRRGRSISLNVNTNSNNSDADNYNTIIDKVEGEKDVKTTQQLNQNVSKSFSNFTRLVYTEPLSKKLSLELNYQNGFNLDNSDRLVYDIDPTTGIPNTTSNGTYSNRFENKIFTNALGFSFNVTEKKYNWNVGLAIQNVGRDNLNLTSGSLFTQNFNNLTPSAQYKYNFSAQKKLSIEYKGTTQQPSISQIQPINDNTNTQSVIVGNKSLSPSFNNNLRIRFNNFDFANNRSFFVFASIDQVFDDFANVSSLITEKLITDPTDVNYGKANPNYGKIASSFVNVKGNYSGRFFTSIG